MIHATVAMPLFNMGQIAPLALEGLSNQQTRYKWELIVCEERNDQALGYDALMEYKDRLHAAGCVDIKYIPLTDWIPLGQKWKVIAEASGPSRCLILQAGDCHPHDKRIEKTCGAFQNKIHYYDEALGYFHSFRLNKTILFKPKKGYRHPCKLNMAWLTLLFKKLPDNDTRMNVDGWIYRTLAEGQKLINIRSHGLHDTGVDVDGYNIISSRDRFFLGDNHLFEPTKVDIFKSIPVLAKYKNLVLTKRFKDE